MKHCCFPLALLALSCAPGALSPPRQSAPAPRGEVAALGRYDGAVDAGSLWVDRTGALYLVDRARWRVLSYRYDGDSCALRFELALGSPGMSLVPGYDGGCCLSDGNGRRLLCYSTQGILTGTVAVGGSAVDAVAISAAGDIFVLDAALRTVVVYDRRGAQLRRFPVAGDGGAIPAALAVSRSGGLVAVAAAGPGGITVYGAFGRRLAEHPGAARVLAFDSFDRVWSLDDEGRLSVRAALLPGRGPRWPDGTARFAPGSAIAVSIADDVTIAGGGSFQRCR